MYKAIQDRTDELIHSRSQVAELQSRFKNREAAKDDAIETLTASYGQLDTKSRRSPAISPVDKRPPRQKPTNLMKKLERIKQAATAKEAGGCRLAKKAKEAVQEKGERNQGLDDTTQTRSTGRKWTSLG